MLFLRKMIKEKRIKVLVFVILLVALNVVYSTDDLNVPDLLHLVKNNGDSNEQLCIAFNEEAYTAIEWSYPLPEDETQLPQSVSSYLPSQPLHFGCDFEENRACNKDWKLKNWIIPVHTSRNYLPIFDVRWEDFRTYLVTNKTNLNENRFEIPKDSNIGISIRSGDTVDILLCEGFNPASYPCYTITLGGSTKKEVYVRKYGSNKNLSEYKSDFPILSIDEWKNFNLFLSQTGEIQLKEINKDISYLNVTDLKPLDTLYLLVNSSLPSLWKIHKNNFLFTNTSQSVPFGPALNITSSTLCLSMYLMMCENCSIYFYKAIDDSKEIIFEVHAADEDRIWHDWKHIKVIVENVTDTKVQLFIKTNSNGPGPFWAVDNVRECVKNEFKISQLSKSEFTKKNDFENTIFSCHSLKFPEWRPKRQLISTTNLPIISISLNTTSIQLYWKTTVPQPYIIKYEGNDICNANTIPRFKNIRRLKSNGWIVVKPNENGITIDNLIPYTHYIITFIDPVYKTNKTLPISTKATDKPTQEEIGKVTISPRITDAVINIPPRKCNISYGPVVYGLEITQGTNSRRQISLIDQNNYTWKQLEPYTNYTLALQTARTIKSLNDTTMRVVNYYNFTTKPDVSPPPESVEIYEIGEKLASFRYKLPEKANGQPTFVQVRTCARILPKCVENLSVIASCKFWDDLYCVTVSNLMKNIYYTFKLSIKNNNTNAFSEDVMILKQTLDIVPGTPANLSYIIVDCSNDSEVCNLNISWSHPYNQSGIITYFEIFLSGDEAPILKTVKVENRQYSQIYQQQIEYVSYAKTYNLSIRACNKVHKGSPASILVQIDHISQHIDQMPQILKMNRGSVTFQLPNLDYRLDSASVMVIVQQNNSEEENSAQNIISVIDDGLCLHHKPSWIAGIWKISHAQTTNITIGNTETVYIDSINRTIINKALSSKTDYCINFIFNNTYKDKDHIRIYHKEHVILTGDEDFLPVSTASTLSTTSIFVLTLLIALVLTVAVFGIVLYRRNLRKRRSRSDGEHIYEAMPNDDYNNEMYNVVYNAVYDKLNHE